MAQAELINPTPIWHRLRPHVEAVLEAFVGVGLFAVSVGEIVSTHHWRGWPPLAVAAAGLITLPLVVARRWPVPVVATVLASTAVFSSLTRTPQSIGVFFALLGASFTAGLRIDQRRVILLGAAAVTSVVAALRTQPDSSPGDYSFTFGLMVGAYLLGALARSRTQLAGAESARADRAEERHVLMTQVALQDERARIARELHDVIAHAVSVIVVQSVGGRAMLARDPDQAAGAFAVIESTGQDALREMRRLLGVLRTADESALLEPQPTLSQLGELIDRAASAGLNAKVTIVGDPVPLPAAVELSTYRIVQEALTNALKHSGPCEVSVELRYEADCVRTRIANSGGSSGRQRAGVVGGSGHGLTGMRERAALCGGVVTAEPHQDGSFVVTAALPTTLT